MDAPLLDFQNDAISKIMGRGGTGGLWMEMGTGKTRVALEIVRRLAWERTLVVCPLSVAGVWKKEINKWWPELVYLRATEGSLKVRANKVRRVGTGATLVVVGYETYWREPLRSTILQLYKPQMVVYDEAHRLKDRGTRQSKFSHTLERHVHSALGLTGTPMPSGQQDLFSIYKAIDPSVFGTRWKDFAARYLRMGGYYGYEIVEYLREDEIQGILTETAYRITKAEALALPPQLDVEVPLRLKSMKIYEELRLQSIAEVEGMAASGDRAHGQTLARVILTNVLRQQQITSGFAKLVDGRIVDISSEKETALRDLLSDALPSGAGRVVVFARFRRDIDRIRAVVEQMKVPVFVLDGRVPAYQRDELQDAFAAAPVGVCVAQIAVASLGIDLSCAHTAIFYSIDYSYEHYQQCRDRLHRMGQAHKVTYYHLVVEDTIDEKLYTVVHSKEFRSFKLLDRARLLFGQ